MAATARGENQETSLRRRWAALWRRIGAPGGVTPPVEPVLAGYGHESRHYHGLAHLAHCLDEFDAARHLCAAPDAVEAALWFHDLVYDPTRKDNEARSADAAAGAVRSAGGGEALAREVAGLVMVTTHAAEPPTGDGRVLADIDLSILGRPAAEFDAYELGVRREYVWVDEATFRRERAKVLRRFLDQPGVYRTDWFRDRYEAAARENLARSIARLEAAERG